MHLLGEPTPANGEILVEEARELREAEHAHAYDAVFARYNPR